MRPRLTAALCLLALLTITPQLTRPATAQSGSSLVELQVDAAYDGFFRDEAWFPVQVTATNNSDPIDGRVIVRPETSRGVRGAFSVPMDLPTGAVKSDTLYIAAQGLTTQIRVELIDNADDLVLASQTVPLQPLQPSDQLYVVITQSAAGSVDLTNARAEGLNAAQANWEVESIPDNPAALASIGVLAFSDVDTGGLTLAQEASIEAWVANGGHLIVTGGAGFARTAAGLVNLVPLVPDDAITVEEVSGLAAYIGVPDAEDDLVADTTLATGQLTDDARVLAATEDGEPLIVRRELGEGVVDYLALDPNSAPLRGWGDLNDLFFTLTATAPPVPAWNSNFTVWDNTAQAAQILPGIDVLPSVLPICGFLALYIALIGPLNYLVLNRINRREWAWVTIPLFIGIFSALAFVIGGQLRGTMPSIGRVAIVRSWPTTDIAHTTEVVGLLSPQRTSYTLEGGDGVLLRSIPRTGIAGTFAASNFDTSVEFSQAERVSAQEFPVDASFIAGFAAYGTAEAPDISGSATVFYPVSEQNEQL
ncbi:MAG: hypothetical protein AAF125_07255, partial [Chloroflexota bacterium]